MKFKKAIQIVREHVGESTFCVKHDCWSHGGCTAEHEWSITWFDGVNIAGRAPGATLNDAVQKFLEAWKLQQKEAVSQDLAADRYIEEVSSGERLPNGRRSE